MRLIVLAGCAGGLTYLALAMMAPQYASEAEIAVTAKGAANPFSGPQSTTGGQEVLATPVDKEAVNTHVRALMSRDLAAQVVKEFKLGERPEFNSAVGPKDRWESLLRTVGLAKPGKKETETDRVLEAFYDHLQVYSPKESRVINIRFSSLDPKLAADVANGLAARYRERLARQSIVETDDVQKALGPKISKLAREVASAEAEVEAFRAKAGLLRGGAQRTPLNAQQLADLTTELTRASAARAQAEARAQAARDLLNGGGGSALPEVQRSPLIQNLTEQKVRVERQISELSAALLPGHPRMRQLRADLAGLKRQIDAEVGKVADSLEREAEAAGLREAAVKRSLNDLKSMVAGNSSGTVELRQLEAAAASKRKELERLQAQYQANATRAEAGVVPVVAQILTKARVSTLPISPKKGAYSALVAFATLLFGVAAVVTRALVIEARGGSTAAVDSVQNRTQPAHDPQVTQVQSPVPAGMLTPSGEAGVVDDTAGSVLAGQGARSARVKMEGILEPNGFMRFGTVDTLARHMAGRKTSGGGYRSLICGETDDMDIVEDVGEFAMALSDLSQQTLIVDWSPEGRGLAGEWGIQSVPGFADLMSGEAKFGDVVHAVPDSRVHIIAAGSSKSGRSVSLDPDQINLLLDALDEAYDHILVAARTEPARKLFETIQGRFDSGIIVCDSRAERRGYHEDAAGTFLGFQVADIELVRLDRAPVTALMEGAASSEMRRSGQIRLQ